MRAWAIAAACAAAALLVCAPGWHALAQTSPSPAADAGAVTYKPPLRGAPGGRVGGASRGAVVATPLSIELLSPDAHAGQTANPSPTLYYFVSRPVTETLKLTISVPRQPAPLVEAVIPSPRAAGIQPVRLADFRVQLQPGIVYAWSISTAFDPHAPSRDVVATASVLRTNPDPAADSAARAAAPQQRAALLAQAGLWYDAVQAAVEAEASDRHAALDALLDQVGLTQVAAVDRQAAGGGR